jgi:hypothetical protein
MVEITIGDERVAAVLLLGWKLEK